jgi:hypothetical protein
VTTQVVYGNQFGPLQTFEHSHGPISDCVLVTPTESGAMVLCLKKNGAFVPFLTLPINNVSLVSTQTIQLDIINRPYSRIRMKIVSCLAVGN